MPGAIDRYQQVNFHTGWRGGDDVALPKASFVNISYNFMTPIDG